MEAVKNGGGDSSLFASIEQAKVASEIIKLTHESISSDDDI